MGSEISSSGALKPPSRAFTWLPSRTEDRSGGLTLAITVSALTMTLVTSPYYSMTVTSLHTQPVGTTMYNPIMCPEGEEPVIPVKSINGCDSHLPSVPSPSPSQKNADLISYPSVPNAAHYLR